MYNEPTWKSSFSLFAFRSLLRRLGVYASLQIFFYSIQCLRNTQRVKTALLCENWSIRWLIKNSYLKGILNILIWKIISETLKILIEKKKKKIKLKLEKKICTVGKLEKSIVNLKSLVKRKLCEGEKLKNDGHIHANGF